MSLSEAIRSPVCTDSVEPSSVMVPPGIRVPLSSSASEMAVWLRPRAASSSWSGVMTTRRPGLPKTSACRTPSSFSRSGIAEACSRSTSCSWLPDAETATCSTGRSSKDPVTICVCTESGSDRAFTAVWILSSALARFEPYWNDADTTLCPVDEVALVDSRSGTTWIACSILVETSFDTTSGVAPG